MSILDFIGGVSENMTNDVIQGIAKHYAGHAPLARSDIMYIVSFLHFLPSAEDVSILNKDEKKKLRKSRLNMAFAWAHEFEDIIQNAKPHDHNVKCPHDHNHGIE